MTPPLVGPAQAEAFVRDGYFVLERAVDAPTLDLLRAEADLGIADEAARIRSGDPGFVPVSVLHDRYVVTGRARQSAGLRRFLVSELTAAICRATVGADAWLFSETFVCKEPRNRRGWVWHQDSAYLVHAGFRDHPPNLSAWIAIDRMTEDNGTLQLLPWSVTGIRSVVDHDLDRPWDSEVASFGAHEPVTLPIEAGGIVVFSGLVPHASPPNRTDERRRAYLLQFSSRPVERDGRPFQLAVPVLRAGALQPAW